MPEFTPVSPLRTDTGALVALVGPLGEDRAVPIELTDPSATLQNFQVVNDAISSSVAAQLGYATLFKGSFSASERAFYLDAMTFTDQYAERPLPDQSILATRWGVGLRVLLRVTDIQMDVSLNFGLVGAAVQLGKAHAL